MTLLQGEEEREAARDGVLAVHGCGVVSSGRRLFEVKLVEIILTLTLQN